LRNLESDGPKRLAIKVGFLPSKRQDPAEMMELVFANTLSVPKISGESELVATSKVSTEEPWEWNCGKHRPDESFGGLRGLVPEILLGERALHGWEKECDFVPVFECQIRAGASPRGILHLAAALSNRPVLSW
jgi:hypothetical protein